MTRYDGRGHCGLVLYYCETGERYGEQLATWGETMGWGVKKYGSIVVIARE